MDTERAKNYLKHGLELLGEYNGDQAEVINSHGLFENALSALEAPHDDEVRREESGVVKLAREISEQLAPIPDEWKRRTLTHPAPVIDGPDNNSQKPTPTLVNPAQVTPTIDGLEDAIEAITYDGSVEILNDGCTRVGVDRSALNTVLEAARAYLQGLTQSTVEEGAVEMMARDQARMREAGTSLAEAALRVIREYDGTHRLALAVAEWSKAIADEGDRAAPPVTGSAQGWMPIETAPKDGTRVLVWFGLEGYGCEARFKNGLWQDPQLDEWGQSSPPTDWLPFPDGPPAHLQSQKQAGGEE